MLKIDLDKAVNDQSQRVELDKIICDIRVYWSESPAHVEYVTGVAGQYFMDIKCDLFEFNHIALVTGCELMQIYSRDDFGGFIVVSDSDNIYQDFSLMYVPIAELEEIRSLYEVI